MEVAVGLVSIALTFPMRQAQQSWIAGLPGFAYMLLSIVLPILHWRFDRACVRLGTPVR